MDIDKKNIPLVRRYLECVYCGTVKVLFMRPLGEDTAHTKWCYKCKKITPHSDVKTET
jgi:hypothetical protein